MEIKIDLHNHTFASYDGFNKLSDFEKAHQEGKVDLVAITDHNCIDTAADFAKKASFPIIIGEEIASQAGDIIGLFLKEEVPQGLSAQDTVAAIKDQGGLIYIPHPFDFFRVGLKKEIVFSILSQIDLFEVVNGAYSALLFRRYLKNLQQFASEHNLVAAAGSDAHLPSDIGRGVIRVPKESLKNLTPGGLLSAVKKGTLQHHPSPLWLEIYNLAFKRYPKTIYCKYLQGKRSPAGLN